MSLFRVEETRDRFGVVLLITFPDGETKVELFHGNDRSGSVTVTRESGNIEIEKFYKNKVTLLFD